MGLACGKGGEGKEYADEMVAEVVFKWSMLVVMGEELAVLLLNIGNILMGIEFGCLGQFVEEVAESLLQASCPGREDLLQRWLLSWKQLLWNFFLQEEQFSGIDLPPKRLAQ